MQTPKLDTVTGLPPIPAMTTQAERECYYRLTQEAIGKGAIIEFGAWLGASTAYIAAAVRDSGELLKAHVYDKFQSKKGHIAKVRKFYAANGINEADMPIGDAFDRFKQNMGDLFQFIEPHQGEIAQVKWGKEPIALIVNDAPKRVDAISAVLTNFRDGIRGGTVMAWQDFCHFPSYEIPASLYRLREHFEFVESVVPGTTLVFRVSKVWKPEAVARQALALNSWSVAEVAAAWDYWQEFVPVEKQALFRCGQAMFLSDIGQAAEAVKVLDAVLAEGHADCMVKWDYLRTSRPDFFIRYRPLFDCFAKHERMAA